VCDSGAIPEDVAARLWRGLLRRVADFTDMWKLIGPEINKHSRVPGYQSAGRANLFIRPADDWFLSERLPPDTSVRGPRLPAFTHLFSSERSAAIIGPTSSGTPARPRAVISATRLLISGLSRSMPPLKSVAICAFKRPLSEGTSFPVHASYSCLPRRKAGLAIYRATFRMA
jgi:hypothetical protein